MKYSVIVPVFNSEKSLDELCLRVKNVFEDNIREDYEIILVNDCSRDNSWEVMKKLHNANNKVKVINLARNAGQHAATLCGLNHFTGDFVILIDDDLQHPPEEIPKLVNHIVANDEIDVVIGSYIKKKHSFVRNIGSKAMNYLSVLIFKSENKVRFTSFRIIRAYIAREITEIHINKPGISVLLRMTTSKISSVLVEHKERKVGKSGYSFYMLVKHFCFNVINNSTLPLKFISAIGVFFSLLSLLFSAYLVYRHFVHGSSVKGWTSLMVMITFFSGLILITLGIIGEYLLRILIETRKFPNYTEREMYL
jgi:dolichol-phosphate mannosyltransferase/undecaprenyl-phosphate 4-deoxy-4-formamido-L-arabinose transferase